MTTIRGQSSARQCTGDRVYEQKHKGRIGLYRINQSTELICLERKQYRDFDTSFNYQLDRYYGPTGDRGYFAEDH
ncbi:hypothetical protein AB0758_30845 [Tolypothrix bouteillei VB521301_2]|uniref:hypothetical protein n=1 Tax=Tolypothrix bouteillei TaxID=1246981 RepID=UPI0038B6459C